MILSDILSEANSACMKIIQIETLIAAFITKHSQKRKALTSSKVKMIQV